MAGYVINQSFSCCCRNSLLYFLFHKFRR